jgi:hypothetical protein
MTIHFEDPEFIDDHFDNKSLSPEGIDSSAAFMGMVHSGSPSLHAILKSASKGDSASIGGESSIFPIPWECNMVTIGVF